MLGPKRIETKGEVMKTNNLGVLIVSGALCLAAMGANAWGQKSDENWGQWRGPHNNGTSLTATPPVTWSETKNIKWKVPIDGRGLSTPIIWENRVFLLTTIDTGIKDPNIPDPEDQPKTNFFDIKRPNTKHDFVVICLDRATGQEVWRRTAVSKIPHEGAHQDNNFASASPLTDGKRLYCWFGSAGLFCFDLEGRLLWERDLGEVKVGSSLGEGGSPALFEDHLVIVRDHQGESRIEVLNTESGRTVWSAKRDEGNAWATPLVTRVGERIQVITAASNSIRSYDLGSGQLIWECRGLTGNVIPCPVRYRDSVICMSGYQGFSAMAISLLNRGDLSESDSIVWKHDRATPYIPSPVLSQKQLFYNRSNQSIISCIDAETGEAIWGPERIEELKNIYASPIATQDHVFYTDREGTTVVFATGLERRQVAVNRLNDRFDASPAVAGRQLFMRGARSLYCIEEDEAR